MKMRGVLALSALAVLLLFPLQTAYGQRHGGGGMGGGGGGGGAPPRPNPNTNPTVIADRKEISDIQAEMFKLNKQIDTAVNAMTADFHKTDEYIAAKKVLDDANAELNAARDACLKKLAAQPDYKAAKEKETAAQAKLDDMKAKGAARDLVSLQSSEVLKQSGVTNKLERDAIAADPGCVAAQTKVADATAGLKTVNDKLADQIKADKDIGDLKTQQTEAKTKLADANKRLSTDFAAASQ